MIKKKGEREREREREREERERRKRIGKKGRNDTEYILINDPGCYV